MNKETYEKALKLACEYFGDNDCPYSLELDFKGCLKDDCQDEYQTCWQRYFLEKAEENKDPWKPKKGENYYFIDEYGDVVSNTYDDDDYDRYVLSHRLVFQTKKEAEDYKWFLDKVDEYKKPFDLLNERNYCFAYDYEVKKAYKDYDYWCQRQGAIYFGDKENAEKFLKEVGEERIKKYWFNIWEEE